MKLPFVHNIPETLVFNLQEQLVLGDNSPLDSHIQ